MICRNAVSAVARGHPNPKNSLEQRFPECPVMGIVMAIVKAGENL